MVGSQYTSKLPRHGLARAIRRMIRNKEGLINQYMSDCLLTYYKRKVHNMKKKDILIATLHFSTPFLPPKIIKFLLLQGAFRAAQDANLTTPTSAFISFLCHIYK